MNVYSDYDRDKPIATATAKLYASLAGPGIHRAIWQLLWALIVQITLVIFTIGTKVPSGLIVPSISIGAIAGRLIGVITEQIAFKNNIQLYYDMNVEYQMNIVLHLDFMLLLVLVHFQVELVE